MKDNNLILEKIIKLSLESEKKYREGDYKGAVEEKRKIKLILNEIPLEGELLEKYKKHLLLLYPSKFDLIYDHKLKIDNTKRLSIIQLLEKKSEAKYNKGDYKGAIKALRRSEKYI